MKKLVKLLNRYKIENTHDLHSVAPRLGHFLNDLSSIFVAMPEGNITSSPNGLNLCLKLNKQTIALLTPSRLQTLGKKITLYSAGTVIELPQINDGKLYDYRRLDKDMDYRLRIIDNLSKRLVGPCLALREHIMAGLVQLVPQGISAEYRPGLDTSRSLGHSRGTTEIMLDIFGNEIAPVPVKKRNNYGSSQWNSKSVMRRQLTDLIPSEYERIYPKKLDLLANLTEDKTFYDNSGQVHLLLPYVRGIDVGFMREIKEERLDEVIPFYRSAEKLFKSSQSLDSESKLIDLMKDTDYEVRKLNSLYKVLVKERRMKGAEIALGLGIMALSLVSPEPISKALIAAIGGNKAFDGVWHIVRSQNTPAELQKSDFFIPWYISRHKSDG